MRQYSFYNVDLLIDGQEVTGFHDSAAIISATRNTGQHGSIVGARGEMIVTTSADKSGTFTFNLLQTSDWNSILNSRSILTHNAGLSGNKTLFTPLQIAINDKMGDTLVAGMNGYIPVRPAVVRGTGITTIAWAVVVEQITFVNGTYDQVSNGS